MHLRATNAPETKPPPCQASSTTIADPALTRQCQAHSAELKGLIEQIPDAVAESSKGTDAAASRMEALKSDNDELKQRVSELQDEIQAKEARNQVLADRVKVQRDTYKRHASMLVVQSEELAGYTALYGPFPKGFVKK